MPTFHGITIGSSGLLLTTPSTDKVGRMASNGSGTLRLIKDNLSATSAPGASNDETEGYEVGSRWFNTTDDKEQFTLPSGGEFTNLGPGGGAQNEVQDGRTYGDVAGNGAGRWVLCFCTGTRRIITVM